VKKYDLEIVNQALNNYAEDCLLRNRFIKGLSGFMSKKLNSIEEWRNGAENHQELLKFKLNPVKKTIGNNDRKTVSDKNEDYFSKIREMKSKMNVG
jgi:formyltetrahydrofolate synthetase